MGVSLSRLEATFTAWVETSSLSHYATPDATENGAVGSTPIRSAMRSTDPKARAACAHRAQGRPCRSGGPRQSQGTPGDQQTGVSSTKPWLDLGGSRYYVMRAKSRGLCDPKKNDSWKSRSSDISSVQRIHEEAPRRLKASGVRGEAGALERLRRVAGCFFDQPRESRIGFLRAGHDSLANPAIAGPLPAWAE